MDRIFDVGANSGQSAIEYSILYPKARIDSFEPVRESFEELQRRTAKKQLIHCHRLAFGSSAGTLSMDTTADHSSMFKISDSGSEEVTVETMSDFCRQNQIEQISLLKIDTEGFDLEVLRGAESLIADANIDFIQVEAGMNPENTYHVYFENFTAYLHQRGYRLIGIYDQAHEWQIPSPKLRRSNIVFASPKALSQHR